MNISVIILILLLISSSPEIAKAGGAVATLKQKELIERQAIEQELVRRQQEELVRQYMVAYQQAAVQQYIQAQREAAMAQAVQQQAAEQFMAQRMAAEIAAYQIASSRREQLMAQQAALQIRVVQNAQYQQAFQTIRAQQYAQKAAAEQVMAIQQQKTLAEYQQALLAKEIVDKVGYQQMQQAYSMKMAQEAQQLMVYQAANALANKDRLYENVPSDYVKDIVSISDLWNSLDKSSKAWPLLIDKKAKGVTISHYIQQLANEGGKIQKDPSYYADMIDAMSRENPSMLLQPMKDLLRIVAIIEYDFQNGIDKDLLARRVFPDEKSYLNNKKRLGL